MLEEIVEPLLAWYRKGHRILPWRERRDAYEIWVSEIMLQQTRVEAVKPFFERFTTALPDISALAQCGEEELLKLWEGLGYYNRVRNMQKAAKQVMEEFGGRLPADYEKLKSLAGIGSYTAGAIASIAYEIPVPAVDGNVLRVISRLTEDDSDILKQSTKSRVERALLEIMPAGSAGDFNQALMELGAVICVPNGAPKGRGCRLRQFCLVRAHGTEMGLPVKKKAKERRVEERTVLVILDGEHLAVRKRPPKGLLAGMFEFPNFDGYLSEEEVLKLLKGYGLMPLQIRKLEDARHIFSHVEWRMRGYAVRIAALEERTEDELIFVDVDSAQQRYPMPAAFAAYARYMNLLLGQEKYEKR